MNVVVFEVLVVSSVNMLRIVTLICNDRNSACLECGRVFRWTKTHININIFAGLFRKWVGGKFVYVLPLPRQKRKHRNKVPRKSKEDAGTVPGQSRDYPGTIP